MCFTNDASSEQEIVWLKNIIKCIKWFAWIDMTEWMKYHNIKNEALKFRIS